MTFRDILAEVIDWLQQEQRISYRALQRQFDLDDGYLQDIKDAILYAIWPKNSCGLAAVIF